MEFHPFYGLTAPEVGWVPAPRYLLRRQRVLKLVSALPRGRLLEVGYGAGALLHDLDRAGFRCTALESSPAALEVAREINRDIPRTSLFGQPQPGWSGAFDLLVALEVLEHVLDDREALTRWHDWLAPGGALILSVPAHPERWNATDEWAGHVRRYRRKDLVRVLAAAGFSVAHLECYGFPLANFLEPWRARHHARLLRQDGKGGRGSPAAPVPGDRSGLERSLEVKLSPLLFNRAGILLMRMACLLQGCFTTRDWGNGYLALARRQP